MKRIGVLFTIYYLISVYSAVGQTTFKLRSGINFNTLREKGKSYYESIYKSGTGFHIGTTAIIPLNKSFSIESGPLLSLKTFKVQEIINPFGPGSSVNRTIQIWYIEVPLNLVYRRKYQKGEYYISIGPYVAFGLTGNNKGSFDDQDFENNVVFRNELSGRDIYVQLDKTKKFLKRNDIGFNLAAGYEFSNKISLQLNGQLGFFNLQPNAKWNSEFSTPDITLKSAGFGASLGYRFK